MRRVVLLFALLLAAAIGWLVWTGQAEPRPAPLPQPSSPATTSAAARAPIDLGVVAPLPPNARTPVLGSEPALVAAEARWIEVRIVDGLTDQPVVGAEVWWSDSSSYARVANLPERRRDDYNQDPERIAREFGWQARSNQAGQVRVHLLQGSSSVFAYEGARYGATAFDEVAPAEGYRLALLPDRSLRVQVLDGAGRPAAGVAVRIAPSEPTGALAAPGWGGAVATSSPVGLAVFPHLQNHAMRQLAPLPRSQPSPWIVSWNVPRFVGLGPTFELADPPAEPIVLQLPATGHVTVRLRHQASEVRSTFVGLYDCRLEAWHANMSSLAGKLEADGRTRFAHVPLDRTFVVLSYFDGTEVQRQMVGPTQPGQQVDFELAADEELVRIAGRVLAATGQPLVVNTLRADFVTSESMYATALATDAQGGFELFVGKGRAGRLDLRRLTLRWEQSGEPTQSLTVPPRLLRVGRNELGDLLLAQNALIVSGRLVVAEPLLPEQVQLVVQRLDPRWSAEGREAWLEAERLQTSRGAQGEFEVRGEAPAGRYRLFLPSANHLPVEPVEFTLGSTGLTIPVASGAELVATCRLPEGLPVDLVVARLLPQDAFAHPAAAVASPDVHLARYTTNVVDRAGQATLQWRSLAAGTYRLEISTRGLSKPFLTWSDVEVPSPAGGDPRLRDIDLRTLVELLVVRVVGSEALGRRAVVFPLPQDATRDWYGYRPTNGELRLPVPVGPIDLLVAGVGRSPQTLRGVRREVTVSLSSWPQVELTFVGAPPLPEGWRFSVALREVRRSRAIAMRYDAPNGGGDLAELVCPPDLPVAVQEGRARLPIGEGSYQLVVQVLATDGRSVALQTVTPSEVVAGAAPIAVQLAADQFQAALQALGQPPPKSH